MVMDVVVFVSVMFCMAVVVVGIKRTIRYDTMTKSSILKSKSTCSK